jgi:hypothetical protein
MQRLHVGDWHDAMLLAPREKLKHRMRIGTARIWIADVGNEDFPKARLRALARRLNKKRHVQGVEYRDKARV